MKMKIKEINRMLKNMPENKPKLLKALLHKVDVGDVDALALAYLINELCPDDRTTKHVFRCLKNVE